MIRPIRHIFRLFRIARTLARHNVLFPFALVPQLRPVVRLAERFANKQAPGRPGQRLARALEDLGPAFIKLGQILATRADILSDPIARDLQTLQDRLPSFPSAIARATVETELERPIEALFRRFDDVPEAAASIAQVHYAETTTGERVAVKVLRPGIESAIERDLDLFGWLAETAEWLHPPLRRLRPIETVRILARSTRREMDLRLEAAAASEFAVNCADDPGFRVPLVDWRRTGRRVVTFEWVDGLRADDAERLRAVGVDPTRVLRTAAAVFFNQVFRDGFFHADMHPGNMLIEPGTGTIVALDFGIMGRLDMEMRRSLAEILLGFLQRDYARVAEVFFRLDLLPPDQDRAVFTQALRAIGEPILGLPLAEISFARLLGQVLATAEQFEMRTQPQLLLLQKTMVVAEGVGRALDPDLNMWQVAQPLVETWMRRHLGPEAELKRRLNEGAELLELLPPIMRKVNIRLSDPIPEREVLHLRVRLERGVWLLLVVIAFLLGVVLL